MTIRLTDIWALEKPADYKIHFARWNKVSEPLEVFVRDRREWQEYRPGRNDFNRPRIFTLIRFYHETDVWLFGGFMTSSPAPKRTTTSRFLTRAQAS